MQQSKIGLDFNQVEHARNIAKKIANQVQDFVGGYTTVAVERTICRLLGIDGIDSNEVPLPNILVDELKSKGLLGQGIAFFLGNAIAETDKKPQEIAEAVSAGKLDITQLPIHNTADIKKVLQPYIDATIDRIRTRRQRREQYINTIGEGSKPYLYIIVATGNIYEDDVLSEL